MTVLYVAAAAVGVVLLVVGLLLDDLFDAFDIGPDWLGVPVVAAALGSFGAAGLVFDSLGVAVLTAALFAAVVAVVFAVAAAWFVARVGEHHTDATPRDADLLGRSARVVTPIAAGGLGEVLVQLGGQPRKVAARCEVDVAVGDVVVVVEVVSSTLVRVIADAQLWEPTEGSPVEGAT